MGPCGSTSRRANSFEINRESTWGHVGPCGGTKPVLVRNEKVAGSNPVGSTILGSRGGGMKDQDGIFASGQLDEDLSYNPVFDPPRRVLLRLTAVRS